MQVPRKTSAQKRQAQAKQLHSTHIEPWLKPRTIDPVVQRSSWCKMVLTYTQHDLSQAIDKAGADAVRSILKLMCNRSVTFSSEAAKHFLLPATESQRKDCWAKSTARREQSKTEEQVFSISRFERCRTCKRTFDVSQNFNHSCQTHTGEF